MHIGSDSIEIPRTDFMDAVLNSLPDAVGIILPDYRLVEINPAGLILLGIDSLADIPTDALGLLDPSHVPHFKNRFVDVMSGKMSEASEPLIVDIHLPNGDRRSIECRMAPLNNGDGRLAGVVLSARDIGDRELQLQSVTDDAALLSAIMRTVPDPMIVIDEHGLITSFSSTAQSLFGYSEDELLGKNVAILMPEPHRQAHDSYIRRYIETGEKRIIGIGRILEGRKKDGSIFPMELVVGEAHAGKHRAFTGFICDLTEKFEAEARVQELQAELVHTSRLSAVGTLASALAHELNQPLTAIANYLATGCDLLDSQKADTGIFLREALDESRKEALRAGQIVRRLRDFVSKGEIDRQILPLGKLVNDATTLGLVGARERGVSWSIEIEPNIDNVLADRVQIQQVMVNLMRNAVEAMEYSPVRHLAIRARPVDTDWVEISVADTGHGVPDSLNDQLFQPFVSTKAQGMGLGLSICRTIVEAHGGQMTVQPDGSGGSIFKFTLPRASMEYRDGN